jgi:multicomponent Na+:H+ antiporter subunit E
MFIEDIRSYAFRLLLLAALWLLLVGTDAHSWYLGAAIIVPLSLLRFGERGDADSRFRLWRLSWFVPYFCWRSAVGGFDVACRALHRRLPITPAILSYHFRLPPNGAARVVFANCLSLFPGTLSVTWRDNVLLVHLLTSDPDSVNSLRHLESQVAWIFGHSIPPSQVSSQDSFHHSSQDGSNE